MECVLLARLQKYLEDNDLCPESMIGFWQHLCSQDAIIQLEHLIGDRDTRDQRAVMGHSAVNHSAILSQVSKLYMGKRTHEYIRSFLTGRTAEIVAGGLATEAKENGSRGAPQGSVISPLLFNLVMIEGTLDPQRWSTSGTPYMPTTSRFGARAAAALE
ncbi:uncharacterized protein LOC144142845 [Haemaphysalis longicornis]